MEMGYLRDNYSWLVGILCNFHIRIESWWWLVLFVGDLEFLKQEWSSRDLLLRRGPLTTWVGYKKNHSDLPLEYDDIMLLGLGEFLSSSELLKLFLGFKYGREALWETGDIGLGDWSEVEHSRSSSLKAGLIPLAIRSSALVHFTKKKISKPHWESLVSSGRERPLFPLCRDSVPQ